jgi:hypothetical protein
MYYEINVAKLTDNKELPYKHFFATAKRSCTSIHEAQEVLAEFVVKFPKPEYNIMMSYCEESERNIDINKFLENPYNPND